MAKNSQYDDFDIALAHDLNINDFINENCQVPKYKHRDRPDEIHHKKTKLFTMGDFNVILKRSPNYEDLILDAVVNWKNVFCLVSFREHSCPICFDDPVAPVVTPCGHVMCSVCFLESLKYSSECPSCKAILSSEDARPLYQLKINAIPAENVKPGQKITLRKFAKSSVSGLPLLGIDPSSFNSAYSYLPLSGPSPFTSQIWILDNLFEYHARNMIDSALNQLFIHLDEAQLYMSSVLSSFENNHSKYFEQELKTAELKLKSTEQAIQQFIDWQDMLNDEMCLPLTDDTAACLQRQMSTKEDESAVFYMSPLPGSYVFMSATSFSSIAKEGVYPETIEAELIYIDNSKQRWEYTNYNKLLSHVPQAAIVSFVTVDVCDYLQDPTEFLCKISEEIYEENN